MKKTLLAALIVVASSGMTGCLDSSLGDKSQVQNKEITKKTEVNFTEGVHYTVLDKKLDFPSNHVLEYFWYGCPHCYNADPVISSWAEKNNVALEKRHSMLSKGWEDDARVFYTIKKMKLEDSVGKEYFMLRQQFTSTPESSIKKALEKFDVDYKTYLDESHGEDVSVMMEINKLVEGTFSARGTPSFVVGGKYKIAMDKMHGWDEITDLADFLIKKEGKNSKTEISNHQ
jgi:thiol:disulfide interchange protein DsbA